MDLVMKIKRAGSEVVRLALVVSVCLGGAVSLHAQAALAQPAAAADAATVTFRRVFEGSIPEFVEIVVRQDGAATADVRQLDETATPQEFTVGPAIRGLIFNLARDLHNFQNADLDTHRRVANLGQKTFRWEKGAESYQTQFNYTVDPKAAQLQRMFENLAQEQADLTMLEQRARFDRLGVNEALVQFEDHFNQRILPDPERFLPILDRIVEDNRLLEIARQKARSLAARIRAAQGR
jgi:hypothetical protein